MRTGIKALVLAAAAALLLAGAAAAEDDWASLFDGKTLTGWRVAGRPADVAQNFWSVQEGAITCDSRGRKNHDHVWLLAGRELTDFALKLKVRSYRESTGNSGVQVRSRYDWQAYKLDGPQVDIHPPDPFRVGLIYDETRGVAHWLSPNLPGFTIRPAQGPKTWTWRHAGEDSGWNDMLIECHGARIKTTVNGAVVTDYDGAGVLDDAPHKLRNVGEHGDIGFQLHSNDELYIQFKDIYLKVAK